MQALLKYSKTDLFAYEAQYGWSIVRTSITAPLRGCGGIWRTWKLLQLLSRQIWAAIHRHLDRSPFPHEEHIVSQTSRQFGFLGETSTELEPLPGL